MQTTKRFRTLGLIAAALLTAAGILMPAASASAYTQQTVNSPGTAVGYKVQGLHYDACVGLGYSCYNPEVFVPAPYVYRSAAASGAQTVKLVNTLYRWNGSGWAQFSQQSGTFVIAAGSNGRYGLTSDFKANKWGSYAIVTSLVWYSANGTNLGVRALVYENFGDYQCVGRFTASCSATDSIYLRSPLT